MIDDKGSNHDTASTWNITNRGNQKYDAWLHWSVSTICNLRCAFCSLQSSHSGLSVRHETGLAKSLQIIRSRGILGLFSSVIQKCKRVLVKKPVNRVDIPALIRTLNKTDKIFRIGFTGGGEPFLISNFIQACEALSKRHYIALNTNLTSPKIKEFCAKIDPLRVVHFHASTHIKELERQDLLETYIANFVMCKERGFNIFSREVAYPPLLAEVGKYKKYFSDRGIELTFGPFCGEYQGKQYPQAYTEQEIEVFGLNKNSDSDIRHFYQKGKLCNAGFNAGIVDPSGSINVCYSIHASLGNIYSEIKFRDRLVKCPFEYCSCPLKDYDNFLFEKAIAARGAAGAEQV
jgi:organic radical activating enzyme